MKLAEAFAANLRRHRRRRGLTQKQLAAASGISSRMYERGAVKPTLDVVEVFADALGLEDPRLLLTKRKRRRENGAIERTREYMRATTGPVALADVARHIYGASSQDNRRRATYVLSHLRKSGEPVRSVGFGVWAYEPEKEAAE